MEAFASEEQHNKQVDRLLKQPGKIIIDKTESLEGRISCSTQPIFFNRDGRIIATPDGVLFGKYGDIYIFEYKTMGHSKRAHDQLLMYHRIVRQQFNEKARLLYVSEGLNGAPYKVKEFRI